MSMDELDPFGSPAVAVASPTGPEGILALLADGLGVLLLVVALLAGLMVLAHLHGELIAVLRAVLALLGSPFSLAAQTFGRAAGRLAAHRAVMLAALAERHGGAAVWAIVGSL